ncbi:hypothetical protein HAX54_014192 [Datura stramonium]|uniref:Aminotransferase-like plant mobile domain-containing protein n=1 Tax=Datura stramonium TaxID=4076 RepID=A0ABS8TNN9_DATST|nr:hypothetical protein [Datura stramonium]
MYFSSTNLGRCGSANRQSGLTKCQKELWDSYIKRLSRCVGYSLISTGDIPPNHRFTRGFIMLLFHIGGSTTVYEAQFDVNTFRIAFPDIYQQIGLRDWGPFTIPVDPYFPKLVWEFYASYRARIHCLQHKYSSATWPCLASVWVHGLELSPDLLVLAQKVKAHENQLVKLAKAIPSMIHLSIQRALQPTRDKLLGLFSTVDALEKEVITLRKEISSPSAMPSPSLPSHAMPAMMHDKPDAPRSPLDDWCVGYDSASDIVPGEEMYHSWPSPPPIHLVYDVDPSWTPGGVAKTFYHELRTLPDK